MDRILLVEDEVAIADTVAYSLRNDGYEVEVAYDGVAALNSFKSFAPHLVILDLMLPKLGGLEFCRIVRKESIVPIIMLTARTEEVDRIVGLEMGADDYVTKPFSVRELLARVRSVLRRIEVSQQEAKQHAFLTVGNLQMDIGRRRVVVNGEPIHLPLKQFELLRLLMVNSGKVVSRDDLIKSVWESDPGADSGSLDVHIRWLREKIESDPGKPRYIRTVRGVGYTIGSESESDS